MIGRTQNPNSVDNDPSHRLVKHGDVMVVGPKVSSDDLEKTLETVNNNYQKLGLDDFYDTLNPDAHHDNIGPGITPENPLGRGQGIFFRSDHLQFRAHGNSNSVLHHRIARGLSPSDGYAGEDRLQTNRNRIENSFGGRMGGKSGGTSTHQRYLAEASGGRHRNVKEKWLGQNHSSKPAASG